MKRVLCLAVLLHAAAAACFPDDAPRLDGVVTPGEYVGARRAELVGGGEVLVRVREGTLDIAVVGAGRGLASLCLGDEKRVSILHASAALGTARYELGTGSTWELREGFAWRVRDSPRTGSAPDSERRDFIAASGWLANSSHQGSPVREFKVALGAQHRYLGVTFLAIDSMQVAYWPAAMADDCRALPVVKGGPPQSAVFLPKAWHPIED